MSIHLPHSERGRIALLATAVAGFAAAVIALPVHAQPYPEDGYAPPSPAYATGETPTVGEVIVHAPRDAERDPATGAPAEWISASRVVRYDDIDLNSGWGAHVLKDRITRAAADACDELDYRSAGDISLTDDRECIDRAVRHALYQLPAAYRQSEY